MHNSKLKVEAFGSGQMDDRADLQSDRVIQAQEREYLVLMELRPCSTCHP